MKSSKLRQNSFTDIFLVVYLNIKMILNLNKYTSRKKSTGYVTVLTLVLFSALSLSLFSMFNSGQIVTHKLKLQNAVDAAAYSSVNIVAREMNYMAYTNRAMVANQLAIGQMVGLASWSKQMVGTADTLDTVANYLYILGVGVVLKQVTNLIKQAVNQGDAFAHTLIKLAIPEEQKTIRALSLSQKYIHVATSVILIDTYPQVLNDNNDSRSSSDKIESATIIPSKLIADRSNFLSKVSSPSINENTGNSSGMADFNRLENVIKKSEDGFVFNRSYQWLKKTPFPVWPLYVSVDKKGGNEFERIQDGSNYKWDWSAMDTVSVWFYYRGGWNFRKKQKEIIPIGGGASHSTDKSVYDYYQNNYSWGWWNNGVKRSYWGDAGYNSKSAKNAASDYANNDLGNSSTLNEFYKFKKTNGTITGPEFIAAASKDENGIRTINKSIEDNSGKAVPDNGRFNIEKIGNMSGDRIYSVAKAQVYFSRSPDLNAFSHSSNKQEYGNLFNPYWQVRLVNYTPAEISAAKSILDGS